MINEPINLSVNITYRCNVTCGHCNRGIGGMDWRHVRDMTVEDAQRIVDGVQSVGQEVHKVKLLGGEPTIHKQLPELVEVFLPICNMLWVVTNGMKPVSDLPPLPKRARYKVMPLNEKDHHAFFVSPTDLGLEKHMMKDLNQCTAMLLCGRGVEPEGFMQCSVARTLLEAMGKDPLPHIYPEPVTEPDYEICRHCPMSMGTRQNKKLTWHVAAGRVKCPSKSFVKVKDTYKVLYAADAHVRRAEEQGAVSVVGRDGLLPIIDRPPGKWNEEFEHQEVCD